LEEAFESMPYLKLIVEESSEAARLNLEPDYSMRSSINLPTMNSNNQNYIMDSNSRQGNSFFFEEVRQ